ncbi:hypothetical protein ACROYT_G041693 [Oculina patagonica]
MFGVPLLLTEDEVLRRFRKDNQVFLSLFADLVPNQRSQFIHNKLAKPLLKIEKEIFEAGEGVLKKFDICALASLLPSTTNGGWCETNTLIPWDLDKGPSKNWLQRLWEFLFKIHRKDPETFSLDPLRNWPIIPTQSGKLAPVSKGKVILDLTASESWSPGQKRVVTLLKKLECHEVDAKLITRDGRWDVSPILKQYLSYPNSSQDILRVLDHLMNEADISGCLSEDEMISVLQFLQDDVTSLKQNQSFKSIVKRLPFFKTFHGTFVHLDTIGSVYVIPAGLPIDESDVWMTGNNCVFLAPAPKLDRLYKELLGVGDKTHVDCYINFIFPQFPHLKQTTRMLHLQHVRRHLLLPYSREVQHSRVLNALKTLAFIPDANGTPRTASHFYDPGVKVFAVMLPREAKPPEPFNEESGWLDLLREIGLGQEVSKDKFLKFSSEVAVQAENMNKQKYSELEKKSSTFLLHTCGRVFVRGDQLAFDLEEELPPYLYKVPREYGLFEHLFKRLGAMEKATPIQFAKLLSRLKESCKDKKMHANELNVAKHAVFGLFYTLKAIQDRKGIVCPHAMFDFLDALYKYKLTFATSRQIVDLLPVHLKTKSLSSLVREELHPECRDKKCRADMEKKCQATNHLRQILFSPELVDGILRILKFQFDKAKLTEDVRNDVRSFQKELRMSCMEVLSTELVENGSNTPISDSRRSKHSDCFVEQEENGRKHIFIKHGADPSEVR